MEKEIRDEFGKLTALVGAGFAEIQEDFATLHRDVTDAKRTLERNLDALQRIGETLDTRFARLERMLFDAQRARSGDGSRPFGLGAVGGESTSGTDLQRITDCATL